MSETGIGSGGVAFFGGSFDPPHFGHLAVARAARAAFHLDTVLFAPVAQQPLKPQGATASFEDRLAMTRLAIAGEPGFSISLADAPKASDAPNYSPNYSFDTLQTLRAELPSSAAFFCLMGADSFLGLRRWHRAAEIPFLAHLIVASRPGQRPDQWTEGLRTALPEGLTLEAAAQHDRSGSGVEVLAYTLSNPAGDRAPFFLLPDLDVEISASDIRTQIRAQVRAQTRVQTRNQSAAPDPAPNRDPLPAAVAGYIRAHGLYR